MRTSSNVQLQNFSQVDVWTLTEPLQNLDYFLFQSFVAKGQIITSPHHHVLKLVLWSYFGLLFSYNIKYAK